MSLLLFDFTEKRALVTGATHGLGMSIATGQANAGATIIVNGRNSQKLDDANDIFSL